MKPIPVKDQQIIIWLNEEYGIQARGLVFLPVSHAGETWVFRVETADAVFFLKIKRVLPQAGLEVMSLLHMRGLPVLPPIKSRSGKPWARLGGLYLLLFTFIEGQPIEPATLGDAGWRLLGSIMRKVHSVPVSRALRESLENESFTPYGSRTLEKIESALNLQSIEWDTGRRAFRDLWSRHRGLPEAFFSTVQRKGRLALLSTPVSCLCHGDLQPGNILQTAPNHLLLIDWDSPTWSPPERDLMFIEPDYRSSFEQGYGPIAINGKVMAYLSSNWLLQELLDCAERILFSTFASDPEKQWALELLIILLERMRESLATVRS